MFHIDEPMREFLQSGLSVTVGTGDAAGRPHVTLGWGPRVHDDGQTVEVFLDERRAAQALTDLEENPRIAVTFTDPVSYRSVQLKGAYQGSGQPAAGDEEWVTRHRDEFVVSTSLIGDPPDVIRSLWTDRVVRVTFTVERAFDQTPGPAAGAPL